MLRPQQFVVVNRAAQQAALAHRQQMWRSRIIRPVPAALAQVVDELIQDPPTIEELHLLTGIARDAEEQGLRPEEVEARLRDTRLWTFLQLLKQERNFVLGSFAGAVALLALLIQIYEVFLKPEPAPPAPQVTVNVTVQSNQDAEQRDKILRNQIMQEVEKRLDAAECGDYDTPPEPAGPASSAPASHTPPPASAR